MKTIRSLPLRDAWVIWFFLGILMLNYPFLHIFNKPVLVFGFPLIFLYFMIGWPISIFIIYLFSLYLGRAEDHSMGDLSHKQRLSSREQK